MGKKTLILVAVFALCSTAVAERQLERSEILEILAALTGTPTCPFGALSLLQKQVFDSNFFSQANLRIFLSPVQR